MATPHLPGRLGNPDLTLRDDPRADPRLIAAIAPLGLADRTPPQSVSLDTPYEQLLEYVAVSEGGFDQLGEILNGALPPVPGVERRVEVIRGLAGNDVTLYIHTPEGLSDPAPASCTCTAAAW